MGTLKTSAILLMAAALSPGATWNQLNSGLPSVTLGVNALAIDPASPTTIYARSTGIPNGGLSPNLALFKSTDAGANWTDISGGLSVTALVIDPKNSSTLYAGTAQGIVKSTNGGATWIDASTGLSAGRVNSLSIDPLNPSTLYAVIVSSSGAFPPIAGSPVAVIFKSTNGGASWSALNPEIPAGSFINFLVVDPVTPATLYIFVPSFGVPPGTGGPPIAGIFKSTDGGNNWRMLNTGLPPGTTILSLTIDPVTPSTLYALFPFMGGGGFPTASLVKSTDGGNTWRMMTSDLAPGSTLSSLVIDPAAPTTFYAAGQTITSGGPPAFGIFKSTDAGQHWMVYNTGLPANYPITSLALDPTSPSGLYAGFTGISGLPGGPPSSAIGVSGGGVIRSTDAGQTWSATGGSLTGFDIRTLATNPLDANTLYAGGLGGVFKTMDGGANWIATGVTDYTTSVVADSRDPNRLYAQTGTTNGCNSDARLLLGSSDGGANWSDAVSPLNSGCILNASFPSVHASPMATAPEGRGRQSGWLFRSSQKHERGRELECRLGLVHRSARQRESNRD